MLGVALERISLAGIPRVVEVSESCL